MTPALTDIAPAFVEIAHRIVWCTVATIDTAGRVVRASNFADASSWRR